MRKFHLLGFLLWSLFSAASAGIESLAPRLRNGDIVFIVSSSSQFRAIQKATKSKWSHMGVLYRFNEEKPTKSSKIVAESDEGNWFVLEATQPVSLTPYITFVNGAPYAVKRLKAGVNFENAKILFDAGRVHLNKDYDGLFLDRGRYCSGLVFLQYMAIKVQLAAPVVLGDLDYSSPEAQAILRKRIPNAKDVEVWKKKLTITPGSIYDSQLLTGVR